jgi:cytochrome c553
MFMNRLIASALACLACTAAALANPSAETLAKGEELVQGRCFMCHGLDGESSSPAFPRLAGQNAGYIARQLADYASGKRVSTTMQPMVDGLKAPDFEALGQWFSTRATHKHAVQDPEVAKVGEYIYNKGNPDSGVAACTACHGPQGHGTEALPRLAGQHARYIENQLKAFNKRQRTNDNAVMHTIASKLTELEIRGVAAYISGLE